MKPKDLVDLVKPGVGKATTKIIQVATNPNALTAGTVVGVFSTTGLAIRATFKAAKELEEYEDDELDIFDKLRITSKYYVGTIISGAATIAMAIGSNRASAAQSAIVASGAALLQEAAESTQKKLEISERNNEEKGKQLNTALLKDVPPDRLLWCRDTVTGAMFKTNKEILDHVDGQIKERFKQDIVTTVNDLYSMLGVDRVEIGNDHIIDETNITRPLDITPRFADDGNIMLEISYYHDTIYNYK